MDGHADIRIVYLNICYYADSIKNKHFPQRTHNVEMTFFNISATSRSRGNVDTTSFGHCVSGGAATLVIGVNKAEKVELNYNYC